MSYYISIDCRFAIRLTFSNIYSLVDHSLIQLDTSLSSFDCIVDHVGSVGNRHMLVYILGFPNPIDYNPIYHIPLYEHLRATDHPISFNLYITGEFITFHSIGEFWIWNGRTSTFVSLYRSTSAWDTLSWVIFILNAHLGFLDIVFDGVGRISRFFMNSSSNRDVEGWYQHMRMIYRFCRSIFEVSSTYSRLQPVTLSVIPGVLIAYSKPHWHRPKYQKDPHIPPMYLTRRAWPSPESLHLPS